MISSSLSFSQPALPSCMSDLQRRGQSNNSPCTGESVRKRGLSSQCHTGPDSTARGEETPSWGFGTVENGKRVRGSKDALTNGTLFVWWRNFCQSNVSQSQCTGWFPSRFLQWWWQSMKVQKQSSIDQTFILFQTSITLQLFFCATFLKADVCFCPVFT